MKYQLSYSGTDPEGKSVSRSQDFQASDDVAAMSSGTNLAQNTVNRLRLTNARYSVTLPKQGFLGKARKIVDNAPVVIR